MARRPKYKQPNNDEAPEAPEPLDFETERVRIERHRLLREARKALQFVQEQTGVKRDDDRRTR